MSIFIPLVIGITVAITLYLTVGWWGFLVVFPWIGFSITVGLFIQTKLPKERKGLGRRVTILMVLPSLLLFVPIANNENFQLEGIVLLILIGFFNKGFIHYAVAKLFGPLIWGRGFCGWACWTAAVLEWLPAKKEGKIPQNLKNFRYLALAISLLLPLTLVFFLSYDVRNNYLYKTEMLWMFTGNAIYYAIAIPLAFILKDRRAFCKVVCPVSLVMKPSASLSLIKVKPTGEKCLKCSKCNKICPMDVDVMSFISNGKKVKNSECILCGECKFVCPVGAIK